MLSYFGNLSPLHIQCEDESVTLSELIQSNEEALLRDFLKNYQTKDFSACRAELEHLDKFLDIPLVEAYFQPSHVSLQRMATHHYGHKVMPTCGNKVIIPEDCFTEDILTNAIKMGYVESVQAVHDYGYVFDNGLFLELALEKPHESVATFMMGCDGVVISERAVTLVIEHGLMQCVTQFPFDFVFTSDHFRSAVKSNQLGMIDFFHQRNIPIGIHLYMWICPDLRTVIHMLGLGYEISIGDIARSVHFKKIELLRYMHEKKVFNVLVHEIYQAAVHSGEIDIVKYLVDIGGTFQPEHMRDALNSNNIAIVEFLLDQHVSIPQLNGIFRMKHLMLRLLHSRGYVFSEQMYQFTMREGTVEAVQVMVENGYQLTSKVWALVIYGNSRDILRILQFLVDQKCPWDPDVCLYAINKRALDIFQFVIEHGCPYSMATCKILAHDHPEIMVYLSSLQSQKLRLRKRK